MRPADYLPLDTPAVNLSIVEHAHDDIGEGENIGPDGKGTNQSEYCDRVNARFGSPKGSYWCGNSVGGWWVDGGAEIPHEPGVADNWRKWAHATGRYRTKPRPGYAALFGTAAHVEHIEAVAKVVPDPTATDGHRVIDIGGNTSLGKYNRDGWIVAEKICDAEHLVGFVSPDPNDGHP
jgi:hypothetical protein